MDSIQDPMLPFSGSFHVSTDTFTWIGLIPDFDRSVAGSRGKWGLSNTRVPTESRPGHVAMIAGLYEDPSAVFKVNSEIAEKIQLFLFHISYSTRVGKKILSSLIPSSMRAGTHSDGEVLISFLCLIKVNKYLKCNCFWKIEKLTYSVNTFYLKWSGEKNNVFFNAYASENEDFTGYEAYKLDEWVFEHFERFIKVVPHNETLKNMVDDSGVVFFFHLLGLDTNGHSNKPHSE